MVASPVTPAPAKPLRAEFIYISVNATSCFPGVLMEGSLRTQGFGGAVQTVRDTLMN